MRWNMMNVHFFATAIDDEVFHVIHKEIVCGDKQEEEE